MSEIEFDNYSRTLTAYIGTVSAIVLTLIALGVLVAIAVAKIKGEK